MIQHQPVASRPARPLLFISEHKTNSGDPFLYHKTTKRTLYDEEFKKYSAQGYCDVLFRNEKDEITEGAISNVFLSIKGRWYTPPLSCGLLNGITRQRMMKKLNAQEKILRTKDLEKADKIILTNSIRGITEVTYRSKYL